MQNHLIVPEVVLIIVKTINKNLISIIKGKIMDNKSKNISTITMAFMTSAAIISLRGLPMMAQEEMTMFFYIGFATLLFLIPASLVSAELGSAFAGEEGGIFRWVSAAFGKKWGFTAIWLQWIQNVVWYPTVLAFAAAAIAYGIGKPELANNGVYTGLFIIVFYWIATFIAFEGTKTLAKVTSMGFLIGTVIPGIIVIVLGIFWIINKNPLGFYSLTSSNTTVTTIVNGTVKNRWFPDLSNLQNLSYLSSIILLFAGVEVQAVHAAEMKNPKKQYPLAILISSLIVFALFTLGSLSIAAVVPNSELKLESGLMQALSSMLKSIKLNWALPILSFCIAFGSLAGVLSWISGPSKGLLSTAKDGILPEKLAVTTKKNAPKNMMILQGFIVTILACLYFVMKDVSVAFFLLSALTIAVYIIMYLLMYAAAIILRKKQPKLPRPYKAPALNFIATIGILAAIFALVLSFVPPKQLPIGNPISYIGIVAIGTIGFFIIPLIIAKKREAFIK